MKNQKQKKKIILKILDVISIGPQPQMKYDLYVTPK